MRLLLIAALALSLMAFGCAGQETAPAGAGGAEGAAEIPPADEGAQGQPEEAEEAAPPTGEGVIVDVGGTGGTGGGSAGAPAGGQADCATMTPTCADCVAKAGCGWCKSRNGCFYGDENGPAGGITCEDVNWVTGESGCSAPVGGEPCSSKTNCADCLTGAGCKWCQEGTFCASSDSAEACGAGGWRTVSYQCYAGQ